MGATFAHLPYASTARHQRSVNTGPASNYGYCKLVSWSVSAGLQAHVTSCEGTDIISAQCNCSRQTHANLYRWAAKEAAIKALFPRVVTGANVVILPHSIYERLSSLGENSVWQGPDSEPITRFTFDEMTAANFDQPVVLVRPETSQVLMKRHVALRRGVAVNAEKPTASLNEVPFLDPNDAGVVKRRARTPLTSYSIAEVSISHDEYAIATVLAEPQEASQQLHDPIKDDGSSDELLYDPRVYDPGAAPWAWDQPLVPKKA